MNRNLTYGVRTVRVSNAVAAGSTNVNCTSVDLTGSTYGPFTAVRAVACIGTLSATQVTKLKIQGSDDNAAWADITDAAGNLVETAAMADADSNKILIAEAFRPQHRYVRAVVERGTANAVIDSVIMELFLAAWEPIKTQDTSVSQYIVRDYPK